MHNTGQAAQAMSANLRDHILSTLSSLPGTRDFHLHVLVSSPRKNSSLYYFARPRPRVYLQDILILLSEQRSLDSPRILVSAIEAAVYHIPATSSAVLYVSKVDSTGQATSPSPTSHLVRALLSFYVDPRTRPLSVDHLWIQLFARAQAQYLFPNSAEYPGKRPLSDIKLCVWWKRVLSWVAAEAKPETIIKPFYILPGCSELEAENSLRIASSSTASPTGLKWIYGHPYSLSEIPPPCPISIEAPNLGHYIPNFDDDPKSRFLDEIAYTTEEGIKSPVRKRSRTNEESGTNKKSVGEEVSTASTKDDRPLGELSKVTPDEFWERMSFRQECVAGAVTGFFTLIVSSSSSTSPDNPTQKSISPLAPQPGQVSSQLNKRIMTSLQTGNEFSTIERSIRATETLETAIKGLCDGITTVRSGDGPAPIRPRKLDRCTPEPETPSLLAPPSTPPPRRLHGKAVLPDVSPNPFPEPVASLETYHSHIYGSISVRNPVAVDKNTCVKADAVPAIPQVTVLTVRRKKKRTD